VRKVFIPLVVVVAALCISAPAAQAQTQQCPPGQSGNFPYCQVIPPACAKLTAKLSLARASFSRLLRRISILAPITSLASGNATLTLRAAGQTTTFTAPVANSRISIIKRIPRAQANKGTGILQISYPGDADTRPQVVRLRAANNPADLSLNRPVITPAGVLQAAGTVVDGARGVVRVQLEFVNGATGETVTLEQTAPISNGRWNLAYQLPAAIRALIAARCGTVHSYTLFTGYLPGLIRGEMKSFQVLPAP
jgi:hypothetical protein